MTNNYGYDYKTEIHSSDGSGSWQSIEPISVKNDKGLQAAKEGASLSSEYGNRALNLNSGVWGGMESGAIMYNSTQSHDWLSTIPSQYRGVASKWQNQRGMLKITPLQQRQKFTYSTVAYIAAKQEEPKTQVFPISDVSVVPHQITFDFYDTTEGRVGVSNAVEKHMTVEFDVYLTDLVATYWAFGGDNEYNYGLSTFPNLKKKFWDAVDNNTYLNFDGDIEATKEFMEFRSTFLQQHSGWVCRFTSHVFGVFQGVITDVSFDIQSGESFAKWHVKLEEAIFLEAYSTKGQKPSDNNTDNTSASGNGTSASGDGTSVSSDSSTTNSGDAKNEG